MTEEKSATSPAALRSVAFCPFAHENPYQRSLAAQLKVRQCEVIEVAPNARALAAVSGVDLLHIHWPDPYLLAEGWAKSLVKGMASLASLKRHRQQGRALVWTAHNLEGHASLHPRLQRRHLIRLAATVDRIIVHAPTAVQLAAERFNAPLNKISITPHPHYIDDYPPAPDRRTARTHLGLPEGDFIYLFLGSLMAYKGLEDLVAAFGKLEESRCRLVIAGKPRDEQIGAYLSDVTKNDNRIDFRPGYVPEEQVPYYFSACNCVALPFRQILTSGSLLLAASFGRAVVVPGVDTLLEALPEEGVISYPADGDNAANLLGGLRDALGGRERLDAMGAKNRDHVGRWGWGEMAEATMQVYQQAIQDAGSNP